MVCCHNHSWIVGDRTKRHIANVMLIAAGILATNCAATAGSDSVRMTITSDRDPDDFDVPKDMKYQLNEAHTFDTGLILGGAFQYTDTTAIVAARTSKERSAIACRWILPFQ